MTDQVWTTRSECRIPGKAVAGFQRWGQFVVSQRLDNPLYIGTFQMQKKSTTSPKDQNNMTAPCTYESSIYQWNMHWIMRVAVELYKIVYMKTGLILVKQANSWAVKFTIDPCCTLKVVSQSWLFARGCLAVDIRANMGKLKDISYPERKKWLEHLTLFNCGIPMDSYRMVHRCGHKLNLPGNGMRCVYNDNQIRYFKDTLSQSNIAG